MAISSEKTVVIVGGGQAGAQTAISLRQGGFEGRIRIIGDEPVIPYQRPPLSKGYMKGDLAEERLYLKPAAWYQDNNVELQLGAPVLRIDRNARFLELADNKTVSFHTLVLATGSSPIRLNIPGADLANVFELRTLTDIQHIRPQMIDGRKLVVVGGGYIGLEAAAVGRQMGLDVTVLEREQRVLSRVAGAQLSAFFERAHADRGVTILTGVTVDGLIGEAGAVRAVSVAGGQRIGADVVLMGVGIRPNDSLASDAGLKCADGVVVDENMRTSDPAIFAVGDCVRRPLGHFGRAGRLESVHNAIEGGKIAAAAILGLPRPNEDVPWFWSDQFDLKLQIAGLSQGHDQIVVRGGGDDSLAVFYLREGQLICVDAVNRPQEYLAGKKMISVGAHPDPDALSDDQTSMKDIMAATL